MRHAPNRLRSRNGSSEVSANAPWSWSHSLPCSSIEPMDDLLRYNGTMRRDPRIEAWFSATDPHRLMVRSWFERMRACGDDVRELFHDGCPIACVGDAPFGYVNAYKARANVGFYHGATLAD